jgi:hypothetical protein
MKQREARWFNANEATERVEESGLVAIIERFAGSRVRFFAYRREERRAHLAAACNSNLLSAGHMRTEWVTTSSRECGVFGKSNVSLQDMFDKPNVA